MSEFPRFSIFPNGTSHMIWTDRNCDRCMKRFDPEKHPNGRSDCDIENAISLASASDGTLLHDGFTPPNKADAIARRLNWGGQNYLENDCPEFVP
jgi:hypothetical protein